MFAPRLNSCRRAFACEAPRWLRLIFMRGASRAKALLFDTAKLTVFSLVIYLFALSACSYQDERSLNIPEGQASYTLKEFSKQANVEIVFNTPSVVDVRTNAVVGNMMPQAALELMLVGTSLVFERDPETGVFAVTSNQIPDTGAVLKKQ